MRFSIFPLFSKRLTLVVFVLQLAVSISAQSDKDQDKLPKLSPAEIVSKHLNSIGSGQSISSTKSRVLVGIGTLTSKVGYAGKLGGAAQFASQGDTVLLAMLFNSNDYPYEKVAYDGKNLTNGNFPGRPSSLASFLKSQKSIVKNGFFGGVLSTAWPLFNTGNKFKLESDGTTKIDGKPAYKLKASGPDMGDMTVAFYFDAETFRHVRSEYFFKTGQLTSPNPNRPMVIGGGPSDHRLVEDFTNFTKVDDLILPLAYRITYESQGGHKSLIWMLNFSQVFNNQDLPPETFRVS